MNFGCSKLLQLQCVAVATQLQCGLTRSIYARRTRLERNGITKRRQVDVVSTTHRDVCYWWTAATSVATRTGERVVAELTRVSRAVGSGTAAGHWTILRKYYNRKIGIHSASRYGRFLLRSVGLAVKSFAYIKARRDSTRE